ncbi:MAG: mitochondrial fission ELM1 family protein [Pseudomonadota bacterium]
MTDAANRIWILADDRAGNVNQAMGVAEAMNMPFRRIDINYTKLARLPNMMRRDTLIGIADESRARLVAPWPDLVISVGRRTVPVARWIKKQSGGHSKICQIMGPDSDVRHFDLIAVPAHDSMDPAPNVVETFGAPHRITEARLSEAAQHWAPIFGDLPKPLIAVSVGGNTKRTVFTSDMATDLMDRSIEAARKTGGSLLVTTSRRTGRDNEVLIATMLAQSGVTYRLHDWTSADENPYFGYLALADILIVTGDSVSMCCEACAAPGGVYIHAPDGIAAPRHRILHQALFDAGYARPLQGDIVPFDHPRLYPAQDIAKRCLELLPS